MDQDRSEYHAHIQESDNQPTELDPVAQPSELVPLSDLPEQLGYRESSEMAETRTAWIKAIRAGSDNARELGARFHELAEAADDEQLDNFERARSLATRWLYDTSAPEPDADVLAESAAAGFTETDEMRIVRARLRLEMSDGADSEEVRMSIEEQRVEYIVLANQLESVYGAKLHIALLVTKALVWKEAGRPDFFEEDMSDIRIFVDNMAQTHDGILYNVIAAISEPDENVD